MTKNPFLNAGAALLYIVGLVSIMYFGSALSGEEDSILFPIAALSVFVLSAAVMAIVFFYQPVVLFFDGKRTEAVQLVVKTVATFAVWVAVVLLLVALFT